MKRYVAIDIEAMRNNNLSFEKWAFLENVYFMSNNDYHVCYASKKTLAKHLCISERQVFKIISELEEDLFLTKNEFGHLKVTNKWLKVSCIDYEKNADTMQKSDETYAKNADDPMQKMHTKEENLRELLRENINTPFIFSPLKTFDKCSADCERKAKVEIDGKKYCGQHGRMLLEKLGRSEIFPEDVESFSFALNKDTHYNNLSQEYKEKLKAKCLLTDGDLTRYENFVISLRSKSSYKYSNFALVYTAWDREKKYKSFTPEHEPALGENWYRVSVGSGNYIAINSKTLEMKNGSSADIHTEEQESCTQKTQIRDVNSVLKGAFNAI